MSATIHEHVGVDAAADRVTPTVGVYATILGNETTLTCVGKFFDFLRALDFKALVFALTAVGVTAMGVAPFVLAREVTAAGAVVSCTGMVALAAFGSAALHSTKRGSYAANSKDDPDQPTDA